ncbi:hypothetical protein GCM10010912_65550 [Paenibacillus albidus]|uniref:Response regulator n=1 Tax=Paenibacillus albidus TaxID=2041023 RepID=A0A917D5W5_9BACL|nr:response regulator [Paenibacillus albidus]GGG12015.1 hypothetical protein GCM10010912_65550 [Paenibacillus albidus]
MFRILIVDDEPMIRIGLAKMIEQAGLFECQIKHAEHGEEALSLVKSFSPHFLFTDIRMPVMDGMELCRKLSELKSHVRIVVISGYSDFEYARSCMEYGVKSYLLKPVGRQELGDVLRKLLTAESPSVSLVPVMELNDWAARLERSIWELRYTDVEEQMEAWRCHYSSYALKPEQVPELLRMLFGLIVAKLNEHDGEAFHNVSDINLHDTSEAGFKSFEQSIQSLMLTLKERRSSKRKNPVDEAKAFIEQNLTREISLEEVAEKLGLNASYFSQLFKQATRETFVQYRIRRKMELAKRMLEQPKYRITDISYEVGYADHPHFTKTFKKVTGYTPSEYRNRIGIE